MVKAEIIESPEVSKETELIATDNVPNVDIKWNRLSGNNR